MGPAARIAEHAVSPSAVAAPPAGLSLHVTPRPHAGIDSALWMASDSDDEVFDGFRRQLANDSRPGSSASSASSVRLPPGLTSSHSGSRSSSFSSTGSGGGAPISAVDESKMDPLILAMRTLGPTTRSRTAPTVPRALQRSNTPAAARSGMDPDGRPFFDDFLVSLTPSAKDRELKRVPDNFKTVEVRKANVTTIFLSRHPRPSFKSSWHSYVAPVPQPTSRLCENTHAGVVANREAGEQTSVGSTFGPALNSPPSFPPSVPKTPLEGPQLG